MWRSGPSCKDGPLAAGGASTSMNRAARSRMTGRLAGCLAPATPGPTRGLRATAELHRLARARRDDRPTAPTLPPSGARSRQQPAAFADRGAQRAASECAVAAALLAVAEDRLDQGDHAAGTLVVRRSRRRGRPWRAVRRRSRGGWSSGGSAPATVAAISPPPHQARSRPTTTDASWGHFKRLPRGHCKRRQRARSSAGCRRLGGRGAAR